MTTLSDIKKFVQEQQKTSVFAIANRFSEDPEYIMHMLDHFLNKGDIKCSEQKLCASKCNKSCIQKYMLNIEWSCA